MLKSMLRNPRPTPNGVGRFAVWSAILLAGLLASPGHAGPGGGGPPTIEIQVPGTITLQPILPQDILTGSDVRSVGSTSRALDPNTGIVDAGLPSAPGASLGINPEVVRQVISLWRIVVPPGAPGVPAIAVAYQLTSPLGALDALGLTAQPATSVDVLLIDLGYRITLLQGNSWDIEGDLEFRFQTASLSAAGRYAGELLITVNFL